MPKVKKLRRYNVAVNSKPYKRLDGRENDNIDDDSSLSRGQKKRLVSKMKVMRKLGKAPIKIATVKSRTKKQTNTTLLSELESTLKAADEKNGDKSSSTSSLIRSSAASTITSNKMKKDIAVREASRMKLVQQHPAFQVDPIQAIRKHLEQMTSIKKESTA